MLDDVTKELIAMHRSDPTFAVLHALRLRGVARDEWLESVLADTVDGSVEDQLASLRDQGLLRQLTGRMAGWTLTQDGRARHAELLQQDKDAANLV